jgi:predicted dehydrogenase
LAGSPKPLRVAILGCGIIGRNHAAAMLRHPRLAVSAVVDPDDDAARSVADQVDQAGRPRPARFKTLTDVLSDGAVDLVVICTPSGLHAEAAEEALAAGVHVVVEKPVDVSLVRARRLATVAGEAAGRGQVCAVVSQHRFDPASAAVARAVGQGRLGRITSAVASVAWWRSQEYYDSAGWRGTWEFDGGGATANQGIHTVDLLVWLLGEPVEVYAATARLAHERIEVEDVAVATVRFASGSLAVLHATTAAYPGLSVRLQVHGSGGSAVIDDDRLEYFHAADGAGSGNQAADEVGPGHLSGAERPADDFVLGHLRQYDDIVEAIDQGRQPGVGAREALLALAVVRAVYLSAALGRPVAVESVLSGELDYVSVLME